MVATRTPQFDLQPINAPSPEQQMATSQSNKFDLQPVSTPIEQEVPQQEGMLDKVANSGLVTGINSLGGGIAEGAINAVRQGIGSPPVDSNINPSGVQSAEAEQPITNMIGKGIGYVAPYAIGTALTGGAIASIAGEGLLTDIAANGIVGMAGAGPGNRTLGGILGSISAPVASAVSSGASFAFNTLGLKTAFKDAIDKIGASVKGVPEQVAAISQSNVWKMAQATENKLFGAFRSAEGNIEANPVISKAAEFLANNNEELSALPGAKKAVMNLISNVSDAKSLADLHDARKIFNYDYSKFTDGKPLTGDAFKEFKNLTGTMDSVMENNANALGVGNKFEVANRFYKDTVLPLINTGAKDTADALTDSTDPLAAGKITDNLINKYVRPDRPEIAKAFLNTLDTSGRQAVEVRAVQNIIKQATSDTGSVDYLKFNNILKSYQDSTAPIFSKETNQILTGIQRTIKEGTNLGPLELDLSRIGTTSKLYGAAGTLGGIAYTHGAAAAGMVGAAILTAGKLLNTKIGQSLLIHAGSEAGIATAKSIISGMVINQALQYGDINHQQ